jgi:hypothetical protein
VVDAKDLCRSVWLVALRWRHVQTAKSWRMCDVTNWPMHIQHANHGINELTRTRSLINLSLREHNNQETFRWRHIYDNQPGLNYFILPIFCLNVRCYELPAAVLCYMYACCRLSPSAVRMNHERLPRHCVYPATSPMTSRGQIRHILNIASSFSATLFWPNFQ